jgi:hypothetical protein
VDDEQDDTAYRPVGNHEGQPAAGPASPSRVRARPGAARPPLTGTGS